MENQKERFFKALPNVTLWSCTFGEEKYLKALVSVYNNFRENFEFAKVKFMVTPNLMNYPVPPEVELCEVPEGFDYYDYNYFCVKELYHHFDTDYVLVFQHDGFIVNPHNWSDEFLNHDYIGAPWSHMYRDEHQVGNGGFSLRTRKLQKALAEDPEIDPTIDGTVTVEDQYICRYIPKYLTRVYDISFAPVDLANRFSREGPFYDPSCMAIHGGEAIIDYIMKEGGTNKGSKEEVADSVEV